MIKERQKLEVIGLELSHLRNQEYQQQLACRAFKATGQDIQLDHNTKELIKTQKLIDFYEAERDKIKDEIKENASKA